MYQVASIGAVMLRIPFISRRSVLSMGQATSSSQVDMPLSKQGSGKDTKTRALSGQRAQNSRQEEKCHLVPHKGSTGSTWRIYISVSSCFQLPLRDPWNAGFTFALIFSPYIFFLAQMDLTSNALSSSSDTSLSTVLLLEASGTILTLGTLKSPSTKASPTWMGSPFSP